LLIHLVIVEAFIYIATAIEDLVIFFQDDALEAALLSLVLAIGTFYVAYNLNQARSWHILVGPMRAVLADYAVLISVIAFTGLSYIGKLGDAGVSRVDVPNEFSTTASRDWLVRFWEVPGWVIVAAIPFGGILTMLFFFDHNVSSLLSQQADFNLKKGSAYHWDLLVLGLSILPCSFLGLPPCNGLIPQAPLHVRSLATISEVTREVKTNNNNHNNNKKNRWLQKNKRKLKRKWSRFRNNKEPEEDISQEEEEEGHSLYHHKYEIWENVYENRVSPLMQAALIGVVLAPYLLPVIGRIPRAVLTVLF